MKVILKRDVKGIGREGDMKDVKGRLRPQLSAADRRGRDRGQGQRRQLGAAS